MTKICITFLLVSLILAGNCQQRIFDYKQVADETLKNYFDKSLIKQMKYEVASFIAADSTEVIYTRHFVPGKNDKENFLSITFKYSYFAKAINYWFDFDIAVSKDKKQFSNLQTIEEIPFCLRYNEECNYIKKDSAVKIAIADSILYPANLAIAFVKPIKKKDYYWFITGRPRVVVKTNGRRTTARKISPNQRKIINAVTGRIISWQDYTKEG
jgi:hypothetical protein